MSYDHVPYDHVPYDHVPYDHVPYDHVPYDLVLCLPQMWMGQFGEAMSSVVSHVDLEVIGIWWSSRLRFG